MVFKNLKPDLRCPADCPKLRRFSDVLQIKIAQKNIQDGRKICPVHQKTHFQCYLVHFGPGARRKKRSSCQNLVPNSLQKKYFGHLTNFLHVLRTILIDLAINPSDSNPHLGGVCRTGKIHFSLYRFRWSRSHPTNSTNSARMD